VTAIVESNFVCKERKMEKTAIFVPNIQIAVIDICNKVHLTSFSKIEKNRVKLN